MHGRMSLVSNDARRWREKALRFRADALTAAEPETVRRLLRLASACENTSHGPDACDRLALLSAGRWWRALRVRVLRLVRRRGGRRLSDAARPVRVASAAIPQSPPSPTGTSEGLRSRCA
jgi:hypothetical protein